MDGGFAWLISYDLGLFLQLAALDCVVSLAAIVEVFVWKDDDCVSSIDVHFHSLYCVGR